METNQEEVKYPVVQWSETEYCQLKVHYEADPSVVSGLRDNAVALVKKEKVRVPGFRPGKAPDYAIKARLSKYIDNYVAQEMSSVIIDDIAYEADVKPIGFPKFTDLKVLKNKFICDLELNKKPDFELGEIKFEVKPLSKDNDPETLSQQSLETLRRRLGEMVPYEEEDVVEEGDQITLTFNGLIDKVPFEGSIIQGEMYIVGQKRWPGFDDALVGMKAGEQKEFTLSFGEDVNEDLKGKTASFNVTVHMGMKSKPHELNEEFYTKCGFNTHEELMERLLTAAKITLKNERVQDLRQQVGNKLVETHDFKIPEFLIDAELKQIKNKNPSASQAEAREQAERSLKLSLILDSVRESEPDSVLNDIEARNTLMGHFQSQGQNPDVILSNPKMAPYVAQMIETIKDEFTLQWVVDQAIIQE